MAGIWVLLFLIFVSSIPVIAVYLWFRLAKYQFSLIWFLFALLAGAAAFFPALLLQRLLAFRFAANDRWTLLFQVFVRIAFTEELSRLLMLFVFFAITSRIIPNESDQIFSWNIIKKGTAAGLVAGLGFAVIENAVYGASDSGVLLLRAITAAPLHAACGSRVGASSVMFRTNPAQAVSRFLTAVAIHGVYNVMVNIPGFPSILALLITLSALITSIMVIKTRP